MITPDGEGSITAYPSTDGTEVFSTMQLRIADVAGETIGVIGIDFDTSKVVGLLGEDAFRDNVESAYLVTNPDRYIIYSDPEVQNLQDEVVVSEENKRNLSETDDECDPDRVQILFSD